MIKKPDNLNLNIIPKTNEEYISITYGCIRFRDNYRFLKCGLDKLIKTLNEDNFKNLKREFPNNWQLFKKKLAYPYEKFNKIEEYDKEISNITKEDCFNKLKNKYPDDKRTNKINQNFIDKNGEELTQLYLKSDVILLADVFEKFIITSFKTFGINPLYCVSLPGFIWECGLKFTNI